MPFTALVDGIREQVVNYRGDWKGRLTCPECGDKMNYRTESDYRVAHFAHNPSGTPGARSCSFADETPEHRQAKQTLLAEGMRFFQRATGELEYSFEVNGRKRRADVYLPQHDRQYPVALEAQYSPIDFAGDDGRSIEERTRDYHAAGMYIIWCIPPKRGSDKLKEALKRVYGCYGELSSDGETVQFIGTNALFLNQHPMRWMQGRREYLEKREKKIQADREVQAYAAMESQRFAAEQERIRSTAEFAERQRLREIEDAAWEQAQRTQRIARQETQAAEQAAIESWVIPPKPEPQRIDLGNGWKAIESDGTWYGMHMDGRRTRKHVNPTVVQRMIANGWLDDMESPISPFVTNLPRITARIR